MKVSEGLKAAFIPLHLGVGWSHALVPQLLFAVFSHMNHALLEALLSSLAGAEEHSAAIELVLVTGTSFVGSRKTIADFSPR